MQGVVLAAGKGTRMRPLTNDRPKALVEVAGQPLLAHCLDTLQSLGVDAVVVVIGHRGERIRERVGDTFEGVPITYVEQAEQLGLAHALLQAESEVDGPFLSINGDAVYGADLTQLVDRFEATSASAAFLADRVSEERAREVGVCELDDDGSLAGLVEKPDDPPSRLVQTGLFAFDPVIFHACHVVRPSDRGEYELAAAIDLLVHAGHRVEPVDFDGWHVNVNTPDDIERVERRRSTEDSP